MHIINNAHEMSKWSDKIVADHKKIALVPTMGCLHEGHLSLMRHAKELADYVVVSIFVNPLQFGPNEDFDKYPRTFEDDTKCAQKTGVDVVFAPKAEDFYPQGFKTQVAVKGITETLCGQSRPGHFNGVTTVVAKLFNSVKPHCAIFGQKDFQQLTVLKAMVKDLNFDIDIVGHRIVREEDGLAMSSRNRYLSKEERISALCLSQALNDTRSHVLSGVVNCQELLQSIKENMQKDPTVEIDYVKIVNDTNLADLDQVNEEAVLAMAVKIGNTRLIDNGYIKRN